VLFLMASFPIFERLTVEDYDLYPGTDARPGLDITFQPGLTMVLGANGLGKTTLVTLLYRMCTGPVEIARIDEGSVGGRSLKLSRLRPPSTFADRVVDRAASARATLQMTLGKARFTITRALDSLEVLELEVDGVSLNTTDATYQQQVQEHAGLATYHDWILLLRHLTFYFEDRRALVWDQAAQRQILRLLFLPKETASEWTQLERKILKQDSDVRNLQFALGREEKTLREADEASADASAIHAELRAVDEKLDEAVPMRDELNGRRDDLDARRKAAQLAALQSERDRESAYRNLERLQLEVIAAAFPTGDATARYLLAKLFADSHCLACGSNAPKASKTLQARVSGHRCVVCESPVADGRPKRPAPRTLAAAASKLNAADEWLRASVAERDETEADYDELIGLLTETDAEVAKLRAAAEALLAKLPEDDEALQDRRRDLGVLRAGLERQKAELTKRRSAFAQFISGVMRDIAQRKDQIQQAFSTYAEGFLLEDCNLIWTIQKARMGETGRQIEYPGFALDVSGSTFPSPVRRSGPQEVSESQREFIDLAFRMSLMTVASDEHAGTLVIDAPESSLDAVFVTRAADVLTRFADPDLANRLVITSNLVEGNLIPQLARQAEIHSTRSPRVVDLLKIATPTAATRELKSDYERVRRDLFKQARREA
jgi:hypothetical protein